MQRAIITAALHTVVCCDRIAPLRNSKVVVKGVLREIRFAHSKRNEDDVGESLQRRCIAVNLLQIGYRRPVIARY